MNILLTSVGRRTYLIDYFKDAVKGNGYVFASNSSYTYSLSHADKWVLTPTIYDDLYIDFLINYCIENEIEAIVSLFDIDLFVLAKNKKRFNNIGVNLIVSDEDVIKICNDKWLTYQFLKEHNIKTPRTYISIDKAKQDIYSGVLSFPLIIKPRWGMGSIGIYKADNIDELEIFLKKLKNEIFGTYLKFESTTDSENCVLIQEKINGQEFGIEILNDLAGKYVTTIAKKKIAMRAGETDIAEIVEPKPFINYARVLSNSLHHIANLDVDCFISDNGEIYVLELNSRFGGQYPFSHLAGVDFPNQIIKWLKGESSDPSLYTPEIGKISCKDLRPVIINK